MAPCQAKTCFWPALYLICFPKFWMREPSSKSYRELLLKGVYIHSLGRASDLDSSAHPSSLHATLAIKYSKVCPAWHCLLLHFPHCYVIQLYLILCSVLPLSTGCWTSRLYCGGKFPCLSHSFLVTPPTSSWVLSFQMCWKAVVTMLPVSPSKYLNKTSTLSSSIKAGSKEHAN